MSDSRTTSTQTSTASGQSPPPAQGDGATHAPAPSSSPSVEMSFLDHLEELRWSLLKGLGGIAVCIALCVVFRGWILREILLGPLAPDFFMYRLFGIDALEITLLNRTITGQFFADIGTIIAVGLVLGSPIAVYYLWRFIEPALYPNERKSLRFAAGFAAFFFLLGVAFGYLIITPLGLQFFAGYQLSAQVINEFDIMRYFSMLTLWALGAGVLFELPVAIYFLTKLGIVSAAQLRAYRKYALIVVLILGALFTPPDPISQIIVALPLLLLYEGSTYVAVFTERRRRKALAKSQKE